MSFREKSAWVMMLVLGIAGASYVENIASLSAALGHVAPPSASVALKFVIAVIGLSILGHIVISIVTPEDAEEEMDERDRLVFVRAGNLSGYVLAGGAIWALGVYLFTQNGNALFHGVVTSLILSQIAEYALQIYFYRRTV